MPAKKKTAKTPTRGRKRSAAPKSAAQPLAVALADAAWSEADASLAEALAECDALASSAGPKKRAAAQAMLAQALSRTARKRGLVMIGVLGARQAYDPALHELVANVAKMPRMVRIEARGVMRGGEILRRARVSPASRATGRRKSGR